MKRSVSVGGLAVVMMASALVGCSMKDNLDDMHGATMEMNQQTKDMSQQTKDMNQQTKQLGEATERMEGNMGEMYDALRQGDSLNARRNSLISMIDAENSVHKLSEAGKYFMSFEYQLWSGVGEDTPESREEVAASAAREFMRDVQEFMGDKVDPLATDKKSRSLNSLAVTMHLLNHKQEMMLKKHSGVKAISMYGMIQESLVALKEIKEGKKKASDLPAYVQAILTYEDEAKTLLQARYNYLGAMALARVSKIRDGAIAYVNIRYLSGFTAELSDKNVVQVQEFSRYLSGALKTRDFMVSVGVEPKLDENLRKIFDSMKVEKESAEGLKKVSVSAANASEKDLAVAEFVGLVEKFKGSSLKPSEAPAKTEPSKEPAKKDGSKKDEAKKDEAKEDQRQLMETLGLPM